MAEARAERRLAAILAADVAGYSRLMGADEEGTLAALKSHRREVIDPKITEHRGRIVKTTGDGMLVEFASVVNAVACAAKIQQEMRARNASVPEDRRIEFRIGINLGDVIVEDNDIYGDGVNIAARIESIAKPGGVAISASVRDNVGNKLDLTFEDTGEQTLKNIERLVRVYNVVFGASHAQAATPGKQVPPDKASIAVLPFTNMSGDPEQEYFSDGISEDIITDLSKIAGLLVIARNSSFAYKNKSPDIRAVGRELGVRSVLEGSIRRAGNRVRITAQLIDASDGGHLWAERYDRDLTDIFEVQDEVTQRIVEALKVTLKPAEKALMAGRGTSSVEAHDWFLRGRELLFGPTKNRDIFERTAAAFRRALELDPQYSSAYGGLAMIHVLEFSNRWIGIPNALELAADYAARAIAIGPNDPFAHYAASVVAVWQRDLGRAKSEAEMALSLSPNFTLGYGSRGLIEVYLGNPLAGIHYIELAIRLDPGFTQQYLHFLGTAYLVAGQYETAAAKFRERIRLAPDTDLSRAFLAAALGHLGEAEEARRVWRDLMEINPKYSYAGHMARLPFQNQEDADRIGAGLAKAGLPE